MEWRFEVFSLTFPGNFFSEHVPGLYMRQRFCDQVHICNDGLNNLNLYFRTFRISDMHMILKSSQQHRFRVCSRTWVICGSAPCCLYSEPWLSIFPLGLLWSSHRRKREMVNHRLKASAKWHMSFLFTSCWSEQVVWFLLNSREQGIWSLAEKSTARRAVDVLNSYIFYLSVVSQMSLFYRPCCSANIWQNMV